MNFRVHIIILYFIFLLMLMAVDELMYLLLIEVSFFVVLFQLMWKKVSLGAFFLVFGCEILATTLLVIFFLLGYEGVLVLALWLKFGLFPFWAWVLRLVKDESVDSIFLVVGPFKLPALVLLYTYLDVYASIAFLMVNCLVLLGVLVYHKMASVVGALIIFSSLWVVLSVSCGPVYGVIFFHVYMVVVYLLLRWVNKGSVITAVLVMLFYVAFPLFPLFFLKVFVLSKLGAVGVSFTVLLFLCSLILVLLIFSRGFTDAKLVGFLLVFWIFAPLCLLF